MILFGHPGADANTQFIRNTNHVTLLGRKLKRQAGQQKQARASLRHPTIGGHQRKFMQASGLYGLYSGVNERQFQTKNGRFTFWGEWEDNSLAIARQVSAGGDPLPSSIHRPIFLRMPEGQRANSTDPFVFGDKMWFTHCKQDRYPMLRDLSCGSIILFVSRRRGRDGIETLLDTVFIVGDRHSCTDLNVPHCNEQLQAMNLAFARASKANVVCYSARMHGDQDGKPFSFVPCKPSKPSPPGSNDWHERVVLPPGFPGMDGMEELPGGRNLQVTAQIGPVPALFQNIDALWWKLVDECKRQGFSLGLHLNMPPALEPGRLSTRLVARALRHRAQGKADRENKPE